jgi:hypothetical protein
MTAAAAALLDGVPRAEERIRMAAAEILAGETAQAPA